MRQHKRALLFAALAVAICGAAVWTVAFVRSYRMTRLPSMLARIPGRDALILYVDFQKLRKTGLLETVSGSGVSQEPEYRDFVSKTNFSYTRDLDAALASLSPQGKYFLLKGRFDWKKLQAYARQQGGSCFEGMCELPGSRPERHISFFPLRPGLMALAVSNSSLAVTALSDPAPHPPAVDIPADPVWISVPPGAAGETEALPEGTRMFARGMENAESILLSLGTGQNSFEARLNVLCRSGGDAAALVDQLSKTTSLLRGLIARENRAPNPKDLSGVLTSGKFRQDGRRVLGQWPIPKAFVEQIQSGVPQ